MKIYRLAVFFILSLALYSLHPAQVQATGWRFNEIPKDYSYREVNDFTDTLAAHDYAELAAIAAQINQVSDGELVVVITSNLDGVNSSKAAQLLGNNWGVGGASGKGVVLLLSIEDRIFRIEVADGFTDVLSDERCAEIMSQSFTPLAKAGRLGDALVATSQAILGFVSKGVGETDSNAAPPRSRKPSVQQNQKLVRLGVAAIETQSLDAAAGPDATVVVVKEIAPNGLFERAGIKKGDIILSINSTSVTKLNDLSHISKEISLNENVLIEVFRNYESFVKTYVRVQEIDLVNK